MTVWLVAAAHARDLVARSGRAPRPPEAFYVLDGETSCDVDVAVDEDGRPVDARLATCPEVLRSAVWSAVRSYRWERSPELTIERVEVDVARPRFTPRPRAEGECRVAVVVIRGEPLLLSDLAAGCELGVGRSPALDPPPDRPKWCLAQVIAGAGAPTVVEVGDCASGYDGLAREVLAGWTFGDGVWRVLLSWDDPPPRSVDL